MSIRKILRIVFIALGFAVLAGVTLFVLLHWQSLPEQIPTNFDGSGHADAYGDKGNLIGLLVVSWLAWGILSALACFPALRQRKGVFRVSLLRLGTRHIEPSPLGLALMSFVLPLIFGYVALCSVLCRDLGVWFLPVALAASLLSALVPTVLESLWS